MREICQSFTQREVDDGACGVVEEFTKKGRNIGWNSDISFSFYYLGVQERERLWWLLDLLGLAGTNVPLTLRTGVFGWIKITSCGLGRELRNEKNGVKDESPR